LGARVEHDALLVADLVAPAVAGDVDRGTRPHGQAPEVPVVAHDDAAIVTRPPDQRAADRRLHLVVIVLVVPEFRGYACREVPDSSRREVVCLPVTRVVVDVLRVVGGEGRRRGRTEAAECTARNLLLDDLSLPSRDVDRIQVAIAEALDTRIALVAADIGADGPCSPGAELHGAHVVVGETHQPVACDVVGRNVRERLVRVLLHLLRGLGARILPVPQNERGHFGFRLGSGGHLSGVAGTGSHAPRRWRGEGSLISRATWTRLAQPDIENPGRVAEVEGMLAAEDEIRWHARGMPADLDRLRRR